MLSSAAESSGDAASSAPFGAVELVISMSGCAIRQMFMSTSNVESREMSDANVYRSFEVYTPIAFGITSAVIFFSISCTSANGITTWGQQRKAATLTSVTQPNKLEWKQM